MRRRAITIDAGSQRRNYSIEISKYEYIDEKKEVTMDDVKIWVYTPLLLAAEKLRALLQQHPEYPQISNTMKRSRARDFYDIWVISDFFSIKLDMFLPTVEAVFQAKKVDMHLLGRLTELRDLHMASWADVELSIVGGINDFNYYFDFVNAAAKSLYTQWIENTP